MLSLKPIVFVVLFQSIALTNYGTLLSLPPDSGGISKQSDSTQANRIPAKSMDCSPAEEKWWNDIREEESRIVSLQKEYFKANQELNKYSLAVAQGGKVPAEYNHLRDKAASLKSEVQAQKEQVIALIKQGADNNFRPPVQDTKPIFLVNPRPDYSEEARKNKTSGSVIIEVELQSDAQVTHCRVIRGLGYGLDEKAIESVEKIIFIPAINNRRFVTTKQTMTMKFSIF